MGWPYNGDWNRNGVNALYAIIPAITTAINERREAINASSYTWPTMVSYRNINSNAMRSLLNNIYSRTLALLSSTGVVTREHVSGARTLSRAYAIDTHGDQLDAGSISSIDQNSFLPISEQTCMRWQFWEFIRDVLEATYRWKYFPDIPVPLNVGPDHAVSEVENYQFYTVTDFGKFYSEGSPNYARSPESVAETWAGTLAAEAKVFPEAYRVCWSQSGGEFYIADDDFIGKRSPEPELSILLGVDDYFLEADYETYEPYYGHVVASGCLRYNATEHIAGSIEGGRLYWSYDRSNLLSYFRNMMSLQMNYGGVMIEIPANAGRGSGAFEYIGWNVRGKTYVPFAMNSLPLNPPFGSHVSVPGLYQPGYVHWGISGNEHQLNRSGRFRDEQGNIVVSFDSPENYFILNTASELTDKGDVA